MHVIALEYHDVVGDDGWDDSGFPGVAAASYKLLLTEFDSHLRALHRASSSGQVRPPTTLGVGSAFPTTVLTFDDGGSSAYREIAPRLEQHGWRGHFFLPTDFIGRRGFLSSPELRDLSSRGHIIGTHSASHPLRMSAQRYDEVVAEWTRSMDVLAQLLGTPVTIGSVPGGGYSRVVAKAAAAAGLRALFTSEPTTRVKLVDGCIVAGRYTLRRGDSARCAVALACGSGSPRVRQWLRWNTTKLAKAVGGPLYLQIRGAWFERFGAR